MKAHEAVKLVNGKPVYVRHTSNPRDIEKQRFPLLPGEINTHLRHGSSVATQGRPDAYSHSQRIRPLKGLAGPVPAKQDLAGDENQTELFRIYTAFKRPKDVSPALLDQVKQLGFDGAGEMLEDAAAYLAEVVRFTHFTAVMPAVSSKPLAGQLASLLADKLHLPVWRGRWEKLGVAKEIAAASRGSAELFKLSYDPSELPDSVLLVDDFVTTRQTLTELARKLYSAGVHYVAAVALCGPAQPSDRPKLAQPAVVRPAPELRRVQRGTP